MNKQIPIVNFGLCGAERYVTDWIQINNPVLRAIAKDLKGDTAEDVISSAAAFVAKHLEYPLDYRGRPTASQHIKLFKWWNGFYLEDRSEDYGWLLPNETVKVKKGICFDSACLLTTLLRIRNINAMTALGATIKTKTKELLGFHAWTEVTTDKQQRLVLETTVHPKPPGPILAEHIYTGKLPVIFDPFAWFNEQKWVEDTKKTEKYARLIFAQEKRPSD